MLCLQVINDHIIRVRATSEAGFPEKQSLMIVQKKNQKVNFSVTDDAQTVFIKAAAVQAEVNKQTCAIVFRD